MQENQFSHMFWTFFLKIEEDMASCSRTFQKPKSAEEERNLIENAILKSTAAVTKWSVKILSGRMLQKTKIQQSSWNIKYAPTICCVSWVLTINIHNSLAVSLYLMKPCTNKDEIYRYKVTTRDVLSTIW